MLRALTIAALLLPAMPALAQSLHETHEEVRMPAGKTVKLYRPIARDDCRVPARHHQAGKTMLPANATAENARCATLAANAAKGAAVAASGN